MFAEQEISLNPRKMGVFGLIVNHII